MFYLKHALHCIDLVKVKDVPLLFWKLQWINNESLTQMALKMSTERVNQLV